MTLGEKLDAAFSRFIRLTYADYRGYVHCFTCSAIKNWKEMDCGHWIPRGNEAVRWNTNNGRPQCEDCNRFNNGRPEVFEEELREEIGDEQVELLLLRARDSYPDDEKKNELLIHYSRAADKLEKGL